MIGATDQILLSFLEAIAVSEQLEELSQAGEWLIDKPYGWDEIGVRARLYVVWPSRLASSDASAKNSATGCRS